MTELINDGGSLIYGGSELGLRGGKPLIYASLLLGDDEAPECYCAFMFMVPRKRAVEGGFVPSTPSYYILDEVAAELAEGFEDKLKAFREKYHISGCLVEDDSRPTYQILKSAGFLRSIVPPAEVKADNVGIILKQWFAAENEDKQPVLTIDENCKLLLADDPKAKRAVRNLMVTFERFARESNAPGNLSEVLQRRQNQIEKFKQEDTGINNEYDTDKFNR